MNGNNFVNAFSSTLNIQLVFISKLSNIYHLSRVHPIYHVNKTPTTGAVQTPGSVGWFVAASSRTKVVAKNFSREALITEEASKIIANT